MRKKDFRDGINILLGEDKAPDPTKREISKTSEVGVKAGETRATFIINKDILEDLKALAWYERKSIKQVLNEALEGYIKNIKNIKHVKTLYKKR